MLTQLTKFASTSKHLKFLFTQLTNMSGNDIMTTFWIFGSFCRTANCYKNSSASDRFYCIPNTTKCLNQLLIIVKWDSNIQLHTVLSSFWVVEFWGVHVFTKIDSEVCMFSQKLFNSNLLHFLNETLKAYTQCTWPQQ